MSVQGVNFLKLRQQTPAELDRGKAEKVADQFETVFVKTLVQSLRQTASIDGEGGGMFGSGPGADTYAAWFDERVAGQLSAAGGIGIAATVLEDMVAHGEIQEAEAQAREAGRLGDGSALRAVTAKQATGGFDVVL